MRKNIIFLTLLITLFIGCGGGGGSSSPQTQTPTKKITKARLVDASVWGAKYVNSDESEGFTSKEGIFEYKTGTTKFYVGKVLIGQISSLPSDKIVFLQDLYADVKRDDIYNPKVLKLAKFLQSVDALKSDNSVIKIEEATKNKLNKNINIEKVDDKFIVDNGFEVKDIIEVKKHLKEVMDKHGIKVKEEVVKPTEPKEYKNPTLKSFSATDTREGSELLLTYKLSHKSKTNQKYSFILNGIKAKKGEDFKAIPTFTNGVVYNKGANTIRVPANIISFQIKVEVFDDVFIETDEKIEVLIGKLREIIPIRDNTNASTIKSRYTTPTDMYYNEQWYLAKNDAFYLKSSVNNEAHIHAGKYFNIYRGEGVKVAVIDDGFNTEHKGLKGAIISRYYDKDKSTNVKNDAEQSHGTEVAGLIGARVNDDYIFGTASQSQLILLKYRDNTDTTFEEDDAETIRLFKKAKEFGADIINCSWGTEDVSESVKRVIQDLSTKGRDGKGIIIVFASGNYGEDLDKLNDESAIPEVIAVGATDMTNKVASYSNYGSNLDVVAPGGDNTVNVISQGMISLSGDGDITYVNGTSYSAPLVSGVIALMLEKNPNLTRDKVENLLRSTADKIGDKKYINGYNKYYGYGKINVKKLLDAVR